LKPDDETGLLRDSGWIIVAVSSSKDRNRYEGLLTSAQLPIRLTGTHEEAVNLLERMDVSALVCEVHGKGIDGLKLLKVTKRLHPHAGVILLAESADVALCVQAMKLGAYDFLVKPVDRAKLVTVLDRMLTLQNTLKENLELHRTLEEQFAVPNLIGVSSAIRRVFALIAQVADTKSTVLVVGESGTGKDLVARALHENSARKNDAFVQMNCGALAESLVESELFGHEKGAFTGAHERRKGRFELAHGGTLFVDEVGELAPPIQAKLLRILENGTFERLGGSRTLKVDVRVIAATNKDMTVAVERGSFRQDLYFRLKVVTIELPPLRERTEDIPLLTTHFIQEFARREGKEIKGITEDAIHLMRRYMWPGNVRELRNCVEGMIVLGNGPHLDVPDLPDEVRALDRIDRYIRIPLGVTMEEVEREVLGETLLATGGDKTQTARILGIGLRSVYRKMKKYGLEHGLENDNRTRLHV